MKLKVEALEEEAERLERHNENLKKEAHRLKCQIQYHEELCAEAERVKQNALTEREFVLNQIQEDITKASERLKYIDLALSRKKNVVFYVVPAILIIAYCFFCFNNEDNISTFNILMGLLAYYVFWFAPKMIDKTLYGHS
jgi:hypothetical protein